MAILKDETLWMPQAMMAQLFDVQPQDFTKHLRNIYDEGELDEMATCSKMEQVRQDGDRVVARNWTMLRTKLRKPYK